MAAVKDYSVEEKLSSLVKLQKLDSKLDEIEVLLITRRPVRIRFVEPEALLDEAIGYAREVAALGAGEILLTSMDRDGSKRGFDLELTRAVADAVAIPVIASGGVGELDHLVAGVREGRASAVLAASIFHFGEFTIRQAKARMAEAGIPVRLD